MIARAKEQTLAAVPDREGEVSGQVLDTGGAPRAIRVEDQEGIIETPATPGAPNTIVAGSFQLPDQLLASVQACVGRYPGAGIEARRLSSSIDVVGALQEGVTESDPGTAPDAHAVGP